MNLRLADPESRFMQWLVSRSNATTFVLTTTVIFSAKDACFTVGVVGSSLVGKSADLDAARKATPPVFQIHVTHWTVKALPVVPSLPKNAKEVGAAKAA
jgi:hypothetical protein